MSGDFASLEGDQLLIYLITVPVGGEIVNLINNFFKLYI